MINYESPVFVNLVLYTIYALLLLAVSLTVWSVARGLRLQGKLDIHHTMGIPQRKMAWATAALLLLTMTATWLLAGTKPLHVNGKVYDDTFWLRTSDMLILTPFVLIVVLAVLIAVVEIRRRINHV